MTTLTASMFGAFVAEINGFEPFAWQARLLESVVAEGQWPDTIAAPTGTGKSTVVDVHVFANALAGWGTGPRVPRRLSVVVNRRAIVDAHVAHSEAIQEQLRAARPGSVVGLVAEGLRRLLFVPVLPGVALPDSPLVVSTMRGGLATDTAWVDDPSACTVICATPDMWGSRILFNGYGSSRYGRPREAALLAVDNVMVLDEAHLNRQLLMSARRIVEFVETDGIGVPALQVVATTATPVGDPGDAVVGVHEDDLTDEVLAARLNRPKPVSLVPTSEWPGRRMPSRGYTHTLTESALALVAENPTGTVGCIVNRVATARAVRKALAEELGDESVLLWVGPMRPMDLEKAKTEHPKAFTTEGDSAIRVLVATQTIEVGVDVDFVALVTELAPGPALVQRAGRLNRLGRHSSAPYMVLVPETVPRSGTGPYERTEIEDSYSWLQRLAGSPDGISHVGQLRAPMPPALQRRPVGTRLEAGEPALLAATSERQLVDRELTLWIREDDDDSGTIGVVVRRNLPTGDIEAGQLLTATPLVDREVFPGSIGTVRDILAGIVSRADDHTRRAFVWRAGEVAPMAIDSDPVDLRPGDQVVLDAAHPIVDGGTVVSVHGQAVDEVLDGDAVLVLTREDDAARPILVETTRIVRQVRATAEYRHRNELPAVRRRLVAADVDSAVIEYLQKAPLEGSDVRALTDDPVQILLPALPEDVRDAYDWLVVRPDSGFISDDERRQMWNGRHAVELDDHSRAVAAAARTLSRTLGLDEKVGRLVEAAGLFHDEGKAHPGFQAILGRDDDSLPLLAKSGGRDAREWSRRRSRSALPHGWRHEQLSVVLTHPKLGGLGRSECDVVLRLVGTSHGRGRGGFEHNAATLLGGHFGAQFAVAEWMFDEGGWEELIEATDRELGAWGTAYLEAVLRAADCAVSKEGS